MLFLEAMNQVFTYTAKRKSHANALSSTALLKKYFLVYLIINGSDCLF